jgi:hypothetical protein
MTETEIQVANTEAIIKNIHALRVGYVNNIKNPAWRHIIDQSLAMTLRLVGKAGLDLIEAHERNEETS